MNEKVHDPRRTDEEWQDLVKQQIQSGLSGAVFYKSEGIDQLTPRLWKSTLPVIR